MYDMFSFLILISQTLSAYLLHRCRLCLEIKPTYEMLRISTTYEPDYNVANQWCLLSKCWEYYRVYVSWNIQIFKVDSGWITDLSSTNDVDKNTCLNRWKCSIRSVNFLADNNGIFHNTIQPLPPNNKKKAKMLYNDTANPFIDWRKYRVKYRIRNP